MATEIDMTTRHFQTNLRRSAPMLAASLALMLRADARHQLARSTRRSAALGCCASTSSAASPALVQPGGKIVAVGSASNGSSGGAGLVRALP